MDEVISYLIAICRTAKGIHYKALGDKFYSDHLMCDRICDGLDDFVDEIFENYYLGKEEEAPEQKQVMEDAFHLIPVLDEDIEKDFNMLDELIVECLTEIQMLTKGEMITAGDNDLLGRISSDLQKKHGFIWRRLK